MEGRLNSVAAHLETQARNERDHLELYETGKDQLQLMRGVWKATKYISNSRTRSAALFVILGMLSVADWRYDLPDEISDSIDIAQVGIGGVMLASSAEIVTKYTQKRGREKADGNYAQTIKDVSGGDMFEVVSLGNNSEIEITSSETNPGQKRSLYALREELAQYGHDLSDQSEDSRIRRKSRKIERRIPPRTIGADLGERENPERAETLKEIQRVRDDLAHALSNHDGEILRDLDVEEYIELGEVERATRTDPRLDYAEDLRYAFPTDAERNLVRSRRGRRHVPIFDGLTILFLESQVMAEQMKSQHRASRANKEMLRGAADLTLGVGIAYGLIKTVSATLGEQYKPLANYADDVLLGSMFFLTTSTKRVFTSSSVRDFRAWLKENNPFKRNNTDEIEGADQENLLEESTQADVSEDTVSQ